MKLDTPCKECIFAQYKQHTQIGCILNTLEQFRNIKTTVLEAYDEDKEFYVIQGRICHNFRTKIWHAYNRTLEEQKAVLNKENRLNYQAIIIANNNLDQIKNTLNDVLQQTLPTQHITIIKPFNSLISNTVLLELLKPLKIKWRLQNTINSQTTFGNLIDFVVDIIHHMYYAVFNAGCRIDKFFFSTLNDLVYKKLYQLTILKPNQDGNGYIVHYLVHKMYNGHAQEPLIDKIEKDQIDIESIENLCPNLLT